MKRFAIVKDDGSVIYTTSTNDVVYIDGMKIGDDTLREVPDYISDPILLSTYYWKDIWILRPTSPGKYYKWDQATASWISDLEFAKEDTKKLVNNKRSNLIVSSPNSLIYNGNAFINDLKTRNNISEVLNLINAGVAIPDNFVFRTSDNKNIPFTAEDIKNLASLSLLYKNACYHHSWELKNQIDALTTVEEIEALDINVGWP